MLGLFFTTLLVVTVLGDVRDFSPQAPDMEYHKNRVWLWLESKCFNTELDVLSFKDYLLQEYKCIDYNNNRNKIYKHPINNNSNVWSLWLELNSNSNYNNFNCLENNITLPKNIISQCINKIYYEPLQFLDDCTAQAASGQLWSLDDMDGRKDNLYRYFEFSSSINSNVEAIVLDTDVDAQHVEFATVTKTNLFTGNLNPQTSQNHGTHVSGTVIGTLVGGAKNTNLNYYAVCQLGSSCAWSDIEGGYEAAIALMESNPTKRYVINYSVGGSRTATNEIAYNNWGLRIQNAGGIWVTSAGNSASNACNFAPAFSTYAIAVGSYDDGYSPTTRFTNYGSCVQTWAPGEFVWSATPGDGYGYSSGTSMASPNIAALAINLIKDNPSITMNGILSYFSQYNVQLINPPSHFGDCYAAYWNVCN